MITIKEIAQIAGVGKATVSRILNNNGYVSTDTREKVLKVIEDYGYQPSAIARRLAKQDTQTIGIIIPQADNPFFEEVLSGASKVLEPEGYTLIFSGTDNDAQKEAKAIQAMIEQRVCGIILQPTFCYEDDSYRRELRTMLSQSNTHVLLVDRQIEHSPWDGVFFDGYTGSYLATEELIKAGNKRIAIITGNLQISLARLRYEGYKKALDDYDIPFDHSLVYQGDFTKKTAYEISKRILDDGKADAVFPTNNYSTIGFLKAVYERNMCIGKDIACISFDYIEFAEAINLHLSYVGRDRNMGILAAEELLQRIRHPQKPINNIITQPRLVLRGSEKR